MKIEFSNLKEVQHLLKYHYLKTKPPFIRSVIKTTINNKIVACIVLTYSPLTLSCRDFAFKSLNKEVCRIARLIVKPSVRKRGIASKMIRFALKSGEFKFIEVITKSYHLEKLFKRNGFNMKYYVNSNKERRLYGFVFLSIEVSVTDPIGFNPCTCEHIDCLYCQRKLHFENVMSPEELEYHKGLKNPD